MIILASALLIACIWLLGLTVLFRRKSRYFSRRTAAFSDQIWELQNNQQLLRREVMKNERMLEIISTRGFQNTKNISPRFTAQFGEDIVLYDFFRNEKPGFFVEAGAYDGVTLSNTYLLESLGWKGILVEPHPHMAEVCRQRRPQSIVAEYALGTDDDGGTVEFTCAEDPLGGAPLSFLSASEEHLERCEREQCELRKVNVPITTLNALLQMHTEHLDFLSLDVEGMELTVLQGLDVEKYKPQLLLIEMNPPVASQVSEYLENCGYQASFPIGCNVFFARQDCVAKLQRILSKTFN